MMERTMSKVIPGVFRVHDSLGVRRTTDADAYKPVSATKPTKANIANFFRTALFSSGSRAEALAKTKKMFDLADLKISEGGTGVESFRVADDVPESLTPAQLNERNRRYWEPDKSGTADADPPTEMALNQGNVAYILTLPPGEYSAEDAGDVMKILRLGGGDTSPELVAQVPSGTYRLEEAKSGHKHLFRLPDDAVPERQPLSDSPVRVGDHGVMPNAIRRMQARLDRFYSQPALRRRVS